MTEEQVRQLVLKRCEGRGNQTAFARQAGISRGHLCNFLKGRKRPGETILDLLGLECVVTYAEKGACATRKRRS